MAFIHVNHPTLNPVKNDGLTESLFITLGDMDAIVWREDLPF